MAASLEEILGQLLVPDNASIQQATQNLKEAFKAPGIVPELCRVLASSPNPQVRHYAAVLLRRKIQKQKQWRGLPPDVAQNIRENILMILMGETEKTVRNGIAEIISTVAKHDIPDNLWPQLFQFLQENTENPDPNRREMGLYLLHSVASTASEQLKPHLVSLLSLLTRALDDAHNPMVPYYSILTMTEFIFLAGDDESKYIQAVIPKVLLVTQCLIQKDQEQACKAMEFFDELLDCEVAILAPHVKTVVQFCLEVAANASIGESVRVKALSFISSIIRLKKKSILKHRLVVPILQVLFPIMCSCTEDIEEDEPGENETETHTPSAYASQVIDMMALHLPPEKVIPDVMAMVEPALSSERWEDRKAAFLAMAVTAEGCAEYIATKHLKGVLQCVYKGLSDGTYQVKNAALFALGQFSEHLQPQISKFASELLPLLYNHLGQAAEEEEKNPTGISKCYYALETFSENLGKDILPYLPQLMEHLLSVLRSNTKPYTKELAISAIGAIANAGKEELQPYFGQILTELKAYLTDAKDENMLKLQIQAIDTLGVLARTVGSEAFLPLASECTQLGLDLIDKVNDPDLRRCVYGLFAALSTLMKTELAPFLPKMVDHMIESINSTEGVKAHFSEEKKQIDNIFNEEDFSEEEELEEEDAEDNSDIKGVSVENSYLEEKEDACTALGELATNTQSAFMAHVERSYTEVLALLSYPAINVRKGAVMGLGSFCCCVHKVHLETKSPETETAVKAMTCVVVPKFLEIIETDDDRMVVMTTLESLQEMISTIKMTVLQGEGTSEAILAAVKKIFTHKTACQDNDDDDEVEDQEAEYDGMLVECAGDILPAMARIIGGDNFLPILSNFLPDLLKRLRETSSVPEKSFAIGTLGETVEACGPSSACLVDTLFPVFMKGLNDEDEEVRSNSAFAVGVLVANGGTKLHAHYPDILKTLFAKLNKESNGRVVDNICAAACRLINTNSQAVPLEQVIPVIVQCLPLKEDFEEIPTVFSCIAKLFASGNTQIVSHLPQLIRVIAQVLGTEQVNEETQNLLVKFVQSVHQSYPSHLDVVKASLPKDHAVKLETCLNLG